MEKVLLERGLQRWERRRLVHVLGDWGWNDFGSSNLLPILACLSLLTQPPPGTSQDSFAERQPIGEPITIRSSAIC